MRLFKFQPTTLGAVRFGEQLDLEDLRQLMVKLSQCKLPFQCAHGRPNVVPLIDFNLVQSEDEVSVEISIVFKAGRLSSMNIPYSFSHRK